MKISAELQQLMATDKFKENLLKNNFTEIYNMVGYGDTATLTEIFLSTDINPTLFMNKIPIYFSDGNINLKSFDIPNNIEEIEYRAFANCVNLQKIVIPDSVTTLRSSAFAGCTNLETADISDNIKYIRQSLFLNCTNLKYVKLPKNLNYIFEQAFQNCKNLQSIDIPDSVYEISSYAFHGCDSLKKLELPYSLKRFSIIGLPENLDSLDLPDCANLENLSKSDLRNLNKLKYPISYKARQYDNGKKLADYIIKLREDSSVNTPLYRVGNSWYTLAAAPNNTKVSAHVSMVRNISLQGYHAPLFFKSEEDAKQFLVRYFNYNSNTSYAGLDIHKARLSPKDNSFSLVKTDCGDCIIQTWKLDSISSWSRFLIKKDYIKG